MEVKDRQTLSMTQRGQHPGCLSYYSSAYPCSQTTCVRQSAGTITEKTVELEAFATLLSSQQHKYALLFRCALEDHRDLARKELVC